MFSYNLFSVIAVYSIRLVSTFTLRVFIHNFDFVWRILCKCWFNKKDKQSLIIFFLWNTFFKQIFRRPVTLLIVKLWQHMYQCRHSNNWESGGKGRTEKLAKKGKILLLCNGRLHKKRLILIVDRKFKVFGF